MKPVKIYDEKPIGRRIGHGGKPGMKRFLEFVMAFFSVFVCMALIQATGFADPSADNVSKPAVEEAGNVASPVAGDDNAVKQTAGDDNTAMPSVVYDGKADLKKIEEAWGIRFESLRVSAAGAIVDFRYRIMNPAKAQPIVDRKNKPYMVAQATGEKLAVPSYPKVGPLRQTTRYGKPKLGKIYYILFANPGKNVKQGDQVTVVIGDFAVKNLVIQ